MQRFLAISVRIQDRSCLLEQVIDKNSSMQYSPAWKRGKFLKRKARKPCRVIVNDVGTQISVYSNQWIGVIGLIDNVIRFLLLSARAQL